MKELTTPEGMKYKLWDEVPSAPILIYFAGKDENINNSVFVTKFIPANTGKFNFAVPYFVSGYGGWEWKVAGEYAATYFTRFIKLSVPHDSRTFTTGYSAGGSYNFYADLVKKKLITAFVVAAGGGREYAIICEVAGQVPARHYHGDADTAIKISDGKKVALDWYKMPASNFITIPGGGHGSAPARAYDPYGDLSSWLLSQGVSNPDIPVYGPVVRGEFLIYRDSSGKEYKTALA